jgi:hypothetical protein
VGHSNVSSQMMHNPLYNMFRKTTESGCNNDDCENDGNNVIINNNNNNIINNNGNGNNINSSNDRIISLSDKQSKYINSDGIEKKKNSLGSNNSDTNSNPHTIVDIQQIPSINGTVSNSIKSNTLHHKTFDIDNEDDDDDFEAALLQLGNNDVSTFSSSFAENCKTNATQSQLQFSNEKSVSMTNSIGSSSSNGGGGDNNSNNNNNSINKNNSNQSSSSNSSGGASNVVDDSNNVMEYFSSQFLKLNDTISIDMDHQKNFKTYQLLHRNKGAKVQNTINDIVNIMSSWH